VKLLRSPYVTTAARAGLRAALGTTSGCSRAGTVSASALVRAGRLPSLASVADNNSDNNDDTPPVCPARPYAKQLAGQGGGTLFLSS
jgi:hypothetical protein